MPNRLLIAIFATATVLGSSQAIAGDKRSRCDNPPPPPRCETTNDRDTRYNSHTRQSRYDQPRYSHTREVRYSQTRYSDTRQTRYNQPRYSETRRTYTGHGNDNRHAQTRHHHEDRRAGFNPYRKDNGTNSTVEGSVPGHAHQRYTYRTKSRASDLFELNLDLRGCGASNIDLYVYNGSKLIASSTRRGGHERICIDVTGGQRLTFYVVNTGNATSSYDLDIAQHRIHQDHGHGW